MKKSLKLTAAVLLTVFCLFYTGCDFIQSLLEPTNIEETDNKKDSDDPEDSGNPDNNGTQEDGSTTNNSELNPKVPSTYNYAGYRELKLGERKSGNGIVFTSTVQPAPRPDYSAIDEYAKNLNIPITESIENAAKQIVNDAPATTQLQKVRAIYSWIALHVDYDHNYAISEAEEAFKQRKAICGGYAKLVKKMCNAVDIKCDKIEGIAIQTDEEKANVFVPGGGNSYHAWNRVCVDNDQYILLDATWGSTGTVANGKELNDKWFATDPCYFMFSHFTWGAEADSLVTPALDADIFTSLPRLDPDLEKFGIDGKELVEFLYSHLDATMPKINFNTDSDKKTSIYRIPMGETLLYDKSYELSYEYEGKITTNTITPNAPVDGNFEGLGNSSVYYKYGSVYTPRDSIAPSAHSDQPAQWLEPEFIFYDDNYEIKSGSSFTVGNWNVSVAHGYGPFFYFYDGAAANPSAIYDVVYQNWILRSGHFYSANYDTDIHRSTKPFDDDPETILKQLFTKIDSSIPLNRDAEEYYHLEYNVLLVPLSQKDETIAKVNNYNWQQDTEFADFVSWMQKHKVSQEDINFYITMSKYPTQRGYNVSKERFEAKIENRRLGGIEAYEIGRDYWNDPDCWRTGGMQFFFEHRKHEERKLFANETIPILLVHIKDSNGAAADILPKDYEAELSKIKRELEASGLTNKFEMYTAEISLDYAKYLSDRDKDKEQRTDALPCNSFTRYAGGWDEIIAELEKTDSTLAAKFKDKNKSAIIKYFDTKDMNDKVGSKLATDRMTLWNIMDDLGYKRNDHIDLFGSAMKDYSPYCFARNCLHETTICPLCMYSFGIE